MSIDSFHAAADREIDRLAKAVAERSAEIAALQADNAALRAALEQLRDLYNSYGETHRWAATQVVDMGNILKAILSNPAPGADLLARLAEAERERDALKAARIPGCDAGISSHSYGELYKASPELAEKIQPHEWDNKCCSEQRDWLLATLFSQTNALKAQVAELQADKERLDWLQHQGDIVIIKIDPDLEGSPHIVSNAFMQRTVRAAIDAAMERSR